MPPPGRIALLQMASGLLYIHSMSMVHRDIKPDNVLITSDGQLKISDFGFCKPANERGSFSMSGFKGTKNYTAPELLAMQKGSVTRGTTKCDVFAMGCVFVVYLTRGVHPFSISQEGTISNLSIPMNIESGTYNIESINSRKMKKIPIYITLICCRIG